MKMEIHGAIWMYASEQISVDVCFGGFRIAGVRRKGVTNSAGCTNDPSGKNSAVVAPVLGVEDSVHEEVGVAGQHVDILFTRLL